MRTNSEIAKLWNSYDLCEDSSPVLNELLNHRDTLEYKIKELERENRLKDEVISVAKRASLKLAYGDSSSGVRKYIDDALSKIEQLEKGGRDE